LVAPAVLVAPAPATLVRPCTSAPATFGHPCPAPMAPSKSWSNGRSCASCARGIRASLPSRSRANRPESGSRPMRAAPVLSSLSRPASLESPGLAFRGSSVRLFPPHPALPRHWQFQRSTILFRLKPWGLPSVVSPFGGAAIHWMAAMIRLTPVRHPLATLLRPCGASLHVIFPSTTSRPKGISPQALGFPIRRFTLFRAKIRSRPRPDLLEQMESGKDNDKSQEKTGK